MAEGSTAAVSGWRALARAAAARQLPELRNLILDHSGMDDMAVEELAPALSSGSLPVRLVSMRSVRACAYMHIATVEEGSHLLRRSLRGCR